MATKNFCDRCGKEIRPRRLLRPNGKSYDVVMEYVFKRFGHGRKKWELCYDCAQAVMKFLKTSDDFVTWDLDFYDGEEEDE